MLAVQVLTLAITSGVVAGVLRTINIINMVCL